MNTPKELGIARQMAALLALSIALGVAFNAVNPVGIKSSVGISSGTPPLREAPVVRISHSTNGAYQNELLFLTLNEGPHETPPGGMPATTSLQTTTWAETKAIISAQAAVLVDARPATAFAAGHIPGAVSLPFTSTAADLEEFRHRHGPRTPLIIYCANAACPIADYMAKKLIRDAGYQSVRVFTGGYREWQRTEGIQTAGATLQERMRP